MPRYATLLTAGALVALLSTQAQARENGAGCALPASQASAQVPHVVDPAGDTETVPASLHGSGVDILSAWVQAPAPSDAIKVRIRLSALPTEWGPSVAFFYGGQHWVSASVGGDGTWIYQAGSTNSDGSRNLEASTLTTGSIDAMAGIVTIALPPATIAVPKPGTLRVLQIDSVQTTVAYWLVSTIGGELPADDSTNASSICDVILDDPDRTES